MRHLLVVVLTISTVTAIFGDEQPVRRDIAFELATLEAGQSLVSAIDPFMQSLSRFDKQVRLQTDGEATEAALVEFLKQQVLAWDDELQTRLLESIERLRPKLDPFRLPLPAKTLFVLMSGMDESGAAYTRGPAIFLPRNRLEKLKPDALDRLVLHELFHVLSRNAPELRRDLYRIIGFETCDPITLPPSLAEIKITNPDAPLIDCVIKLMDGGETRYVAPVLYSSSTTYDTEAKPSLLKYLKFQLMVVEQHESRWRPLLKDDEPVLIAPADSKSFATQIGGNTKYIIHPDEILADNFVHLILQTEDLKSPQIVEQMRDRLTQPN